MQKHYRLWSLLLCLLLPLVLRASPPELMPVDDIRPGMLGIGKTVFAGTEIEEFEVEILAVLKNNGQHGDAIMAKVTGGPLPLEKVGVVAGMSGSPIYIDGKLIGALAFGQTFETEPMIAGITPIHEMLADAARVPTTTGEPVAWPEADPDGLWNTVPIQAPLLVSGGDSRLLPLIREELSAFSVVPVQGGSATGAMLQEFSPELEPGSSVGVQLVRGDMNMTAVGTVTYRDEGRILAFGHPMFWAGDVNWPMTSAYVHFVWSNQLIPFKVASPLHAVGAITQDRRTGIFGTLGASPKMIPLEVSLTSTDGQWPDRRYTFEVIDHDAFTPMLLGLAGINAVLAAEGPMGKATVTTQATIQFQDHPPLELQHVATSDQELLLSVLKAFAPLDAVLKNPFAPVTLEQVSVEMTVTHDIRSAELVGVQIEHDVVQAGETLDVMMTLRPYGDEPALTIVEPITVPEILQNELVQLVVCDANASTMLDVGRAAEKYQPRSVDHLIRLLNERMQANQIVVSLLHIQPGLVVEGRELPSPPLSMLTLMGASRRASTHTSMTRGRILLRKQIPTSYVVNGCAALPLRVNHSGGNPDDIVYPMQGE